MKVGQRISANNLPKCNGRKQLWITHEGDNQFRVRVIYKSGLVRYSIYNKTHVSVNSALRRAKENPSYLYRGCTSAYTQQKAQENAVNYFGTCRTYFKGYIK